MRIIFSIIAMIFALNVFAEKDVTTFLGIPVDGYKSEMRKKLIAKGFTPKQVSGQEYFEGEFNGAKVNVYIVTNNNKVYRLMLCDVVEQNEAEIKIRFNNLVRQFEKNQRYITMKDYRIPEYEDISYGMTVSNKVYDAAYYQEPIWNKMDTLELQNKMIQLLQKEGYTEEQIQNLSEDKKNDIVTKVSLDLFSKKTVWFRIIERYGNYSILMYYDNNYNCADGEDL